MEDLDHILLDQLHAMKRNMKLIKKLKKLFPKNKDIEEVEKANKLRQEFFESMIENKSILDKKLKKKEKVEDVLDRNPMYYLYRNTIMTAAFGYMFFVNSIQKYWEQFKDKE